MLLQSQEQQMSNLIICNFFHANFPEYAFIYVLNILNGIDFIVSILHLNNFINALLLFIVLCRNLNKIFFDGNT